VEPSVDPAHIGVTTQDGVVTLSGHVPTVAEKLAAETAVRRVKGVKAVAEEIQVRLAFEAKRGDDQIAAAAADRLTWDVSVPDATKVKVEKGWVTLDGQVEWYYQKDAAQRAVRNSLRCDPHQRLDHHQADGEHLRVSTRLLGLAPTGALCA
jgi:osmotically-inducible protein OsmY